MKKTLQQCRDDWYKENSPLGRALGYPDCCIRAFCNQPPQVLEITGTDMDDKRRLKAGSINGKFTGFIPCLEHAYQILRGEIQLHDLIENRDKQFPQFPYYALH